MKKIRDKLDIEVTAEQFSNTIFKIAFAYTKSKELSEDILQNVLIKYMTSTYEFNDEEHKKAWLIRVTINECKKYFRWLSYRIKNETAGLLNNTEAISHDLYDSVMDLPEKYRIVIHLFYYEELTVKEISAALQMKENTVLSLLHRGRKKLKKILEVDYGY